MSHHFIRKQSAFSLVEVLIALLILAIGMLALAASEIMGQRGTQSSLKRSHATTLANDMAERIHANPTGNYIRPSLSRADCPLAEEIPVCSAAISNGGQVTKCDADEMALYDLEKWFCGNSSFRSGVVTLLGGAETDDDLSTGLPVSAAIRCPDAGEDTQNRCPTGSTYFIALTWREREPNREQNTTNQAHGRLISKTLEIAVVP
jgi:type IV pilus assembly protein PilV